MSVSVDLSSVTDSLFHDEWLNGGDDSTKIAAPRIYGRKREQSILLRTYQKLEQCNKARQIVMLHGCSGTGKTALVEQFRESLCETEEVHFCAGKFFQNADVQEPYSAIMAAFSDLCDLVSQADDFTEGRKLQIRHQLGREADILSKIMSSLAPFLHSMENPRDTAFEDLTDDSALYKFKIACKKFLQAMSSGRRPVVVFLDDIQWMDMGSKHLIEMYLSDSELKNVMFILAYRDEETDAVARVLSSVKNTRDFVDLSVENLSSDEVCDLMSGIMNSPMSDQLREFADLVQKRSEGNTFHVLQFIEAIEREKLLCFDSDAGSWIYSVEEIQREVMASDSLTDLLLRRIQLLPQDEQETLKIASLIGYEFEASDIFEIARVMNNHQVMEATSIVSLSLIMAVNLGIIEILPNGTTCIFSHDKLQSSFHSMLSDWEEQMLQRVIGEFFLASSSKDSIYRAAVHLNRTVEAKGDPKFRLKLARLNLKASEHCKNRSAFDVAASLLRDGLVLLEGDTMWLSNFDLAFEMTEALARMELFTGNLEECKKLTKQTLLRATSLEMKVNSLLLDVECHMAGNEMSSVIESAYKALTTLGFKVPKRKVSAGRVFLKLLSVRRKLRRKTDEDILQLPIIEDCVIEAATRILVNVGVACALQDEGMPGIYSLLSAAELTLLHGLSPHSATAFIIYASVELRFGFYARGYRFGTLAMKILEKIKCRDTECAAISLWITSIRHWEVPLRDLRSSILDAVSAGFETGDTVYTAIAIANAFGMSFFLGDNLYELEEFMRRTYNQLLDLSQEAMLLWAQPAFQAVLNLQSESTEFNDLVVLSGEIMMEDEYFCKAIEARHPILMIIAWTYKGALAYDFGNIELAMQIYEAVGDIGEAFRNNYGSLALFLYGSLTYYEQFGKTGNRRFLKLARKHKTELERFKSLRNPNAESCVAVLRAQDMATRKSATVESVRAAFDFAAKVAAEQKFTHYESLANQRAAFFMADKGMYDESNQYFDRAIDLVEKWGSPCNAAWLQDKRTELLPRKEQQEMAAFLGEHILVRSSSGKNSK